MSYIEDRRVREFDKTLMLEKRIAKTSDYVLQIAGITPLRTNNRNEQTRGIDFFVCEDPSMYVDEKAAAGYWDRDIDTFTIEIGNGFNKNKAGWFFNSISITSHYLFVWVRADDSSLAHIYRWEGMLVEKKIVEALFQLIGYSKFEIEELVKRRGFKTKKNGKVFPLYRGKHSAVKIFYSTNNVECNVNLQISKCWLESMCVRHIVWEDGKGLLINDSKAPDISFEIQNVCTKIRRKKVSELNGIIKAYARKGE